MTVQEVLDKIRGERDIPGRFPTRVVFVSNFNDYSYLVDELKKECDAVLNLASYARGDLFPDFHAFKNELTKFDGEVVLLLSFGEYLRLCLKREMKHESAIFPDLWSTIQAVDKTTKYVIPLFGDRGIFDRVVEYVDERQRDFLWEVDEGTKRSEYTIKVFSPEFSESIDADADNFGEWLSIWDGLYSIGEKREFTLISNLVRYTESAIGDISINVLNAPFGYVADLVADGDLLSNDWGPEGFWAELIPHLKIREPFSETVKSVFNMGEFFDPLTLIAKFQVLSDTEKRLLWIWYRLYPDNSYYSLAIRRASNADRIPIKLRDIIFEKPEPSTEMLYERAEALKLLKPNYESDYFAQLDKIFPLWNRFFYLTYRTLEEKAYAIKSVSKLLKQDAKLSSIADHLQSNYPDLAEYLFASVECDSPIEKYFDWYRRQKILNIVPDVVPLDIDFDILDSRHKAIQDYGDCTIFWIDGLGVEWLPLLSKKLAQLNIIKSIDMKIGRALLPTVTEYNRRWRETDEKWDRLDKLSHEGIPDNKNYFFCIARQLEIIGEIASRVGLLMKKHHQIILTGDHGSSRLAALMFHVSDNYAVEPPENSVVCSFGRYCELCGTESYLPTDEMELVQVDNRRFLVMKTYRHFKQSGNPAGGSTEGNPIAGEVHGGMTPEEYLVPVIRVKSNKVKSTLSKTEERKPARLADMGI